MSGGASLGLRSSGSYRSLPSLAARKPSKMPLAAGGLRSRFHRICKLAGRRHAGGMALLLLVASAAVFCFLFSSLVTRDEDASSGIETTLGISNHVRSFVSPVWAASDKSIIQSDLESTISQTDKRSHNGDEKIRVPPRSFPPTVVLEHYPCENVSFPPPPVDRKRIGPRPCPVCYVPVELALALMPRSPSTSPALHSLNYLFEEKLIFKDSNGGSLFGEHPSLEERDKSYDIKESMTVHCGFVKGKTPGRDTGFDIDEADLSEMYQCQGTVVASAIFGNYDILQQPENISEFSKDTVCFFVFMDEESEAAIKNSTTIDSSKRVGLWRVVVVRDLPYSDARRNGKVPKLLLHRLFPNVRFSL